MLLKSETGIKMLQWQHHHGTQTLVQEPGLCQCPHTSRFFCQQLLLIQKIKNRVPALCFCWLLIMILYLPPRPLTLGKENISSFSNFTLHIKSVESRWARPGWCPPHQHQRTLWHEDQKGGYYQIRHWSILIICFWQNIIINSMQYY